MTRKIVLKLLILLLASVTFALIDDDFRREFEDDDRHEELLQILEEHRDKTTPEIMQIMRSPGPKDQVFTFDKPDGLEDELASKAQTYGVIIDCGSSGTRAHIYHWDTEIDLSPQMLHDIEPLRNETTGAQITKKVEPGLSEMADKTQAERVKYIKPLIDYIASKIPKARHKFTGVYFMATAGMRLLDELDRDSIMADIRQFVRDEYDFLKVDTSVISGADEGMYQWISINAKGKRFLARDTNVRTRTYAVIEMGGASIQVTYQLRPGVGELTVRSIPRSARPIYWNQVVEPAISRNDVLKQNYMLHSTTFLGLGVNSARDAYLDLLIYQARRGFDIVEGAKRLFSACFMGGKNSKNPVCQEDEFEDPCLPAGYVTEEEITKPTRMLARKTRDRRTIGFIVDSEEPTFSFKLRGTGNYDKCRKLVEKMIHVAKKENLFCDKDAEDDCTMSLLGERFVPFQRFDFLAISGFYYAFYNPMIGTREIYNHNQIVYKTRQICNMPLIKLEKLFKDKMKKEHMITACFRAVYANAFLVKGLHMPEDFDMLETKNKINNDDLDWTLGAVLDKSVDIEYVTENVNGPAPKRR